jgi:hypothetical protein
MPARAPDRDERFDGRDDPGPAAFAIGHLVCRICRQVTLRTPYCEAAAASSFLRILSGGASSPSRQRAEIIADNLNPVP